MKEERKGRTDDAAGTLGKREVKLLMRLREAENIEFRLQTQLRPIR